MGIFDSFLGGDDPLQTRRRTTIDTPGSRISAQLEPIISRFGTTPLQPGQSTVSGFNPTELLAQQGALRAAQGQVAPGAAGALDFSSFLSSQNLFDPARFQTLLDSIATRGTRNLTDVLLPQVRGEANLAGQVGSSRQGIAEGIVTARTGEDILAEQARALVSGQQQALDVGSRNLFNVPALLQTALFGPQIQAGVGGAERQLTDAQAAEANRLSLLQQQSEFLPAVAALSAAQGLTGGTTTSTNVAAEAEGSSPLSSALGLAVTGATIGSVGGPAGAAIGAGVGAGAGLLMSLFS